MGISAMHITVGQYLIKRLHEAGVRQVFGIPGDYILDFYEQLYEGPLEHVGTCTELGAGFAADAYSRVHGLGVVCVTYCVGGFNCLNAVAGAYAEKSPLVVICGAPGLLERGRSALLHHQVKDHRTQLDIFARVTEAAVALDDPARAPEAIDAVLDLCQRRKRPVYIELPRDMARARCMAPRRHKRTMPVSNPATLMEAAADAVELLNQAKRPVILAGVEIHRFALQDALVRLVEQSGLPVAATLLGKSIIREDHANYLGVYEGAMGQARVRRAVERSDCLLVLGAFMTDINLGANTAQLDVDCTINASSERISIRRHHYEDVRLDDFIAALAKGLRRRRNIGKPRDRKAPPFRPKTGQPMTIRRLFNRIDAFLTRNHMVICDIGDSLFAAADLIIRERTEFISPAYYTSMGFAIPAAVGAQMAAPKLRPLVIVGDGAFQMTGQELATIARNKLNPIVIVLNNKGYTTERYIKDGAFNDIHEWAYHRMPDLLQAGWGAEVHTEDEFEAALMTASKNTSAFSILNVHLDPWDRSNSLERLGQSLASRK
ncbi:MAG: alpha-keto acid decarboxylase family protein [Candidatus Hydrogenedentes bacterium]|nr:alpha-keto acid decarboxylase family protein [Candidatus Hydrogenedentota bacterium]